MNNPEGDREKGNLIFHYQWKFNKSFDNLLILLVCIFIILYFPFLIYATFILKMWVLFFLIVVVYVLTLDYVINNRKNKKRMHFDIYETGIWHPYPFFTLKWTGTFYSFGKIIHIDIIPVKSPKYSYLTINTQSGENRKLFFKKEDAEELYKKINEAWEVYKKRTQNTGN